VSKFYRDKAKEDQRIKQTQAVKDQVKKGLKEYEDQLNEQADEIYAMLESSPAFTPKFLKNLEKKDIKAEIQSTSYEEVLASKLELIQKANKWDSKPFRILRIIGFVICLAALISIFVFINNFDYEATCIKYDLDC
tara:strand:- start:37 stop:444 length:408 start_codon:yes stop_codon:yes gene_type:complete